MKKLALFLLMMVWGGVAVATCTPDLTVCPSGCDYSVLDSAVSDLETNCASPSSPLTITISGSWSGSDTTPVSISGIGTSSTNKFTLTSTGTARHSGVYSTTGNYSLVSSSATNLFNSGIHYATIDGIVLRNTSTAAYPNTLLIGNYAHDVTVSNCIVRQGTEGYGSSGIYTYTNNANIYIINNIVFGSSADYGAGIKAGYFGDFHLLNNTVYGSFSNGVAINGSSSTNATYKNNLAFNTWRQNSGDIYSFGTTPTAVTNGSGNSDGDISSLVAADIFENLTDDFHVVAGSDAIDVGTDLHTTFTVDIDGETRSGTWDIGADEYVSAVTSYGLSILRGGSIIRGGSLIK